MAYKKFTEEQLTRANETDLVSFLQSQGETLKAAGSEYVWQHGADKISIRGNRWYNHYAQEGGKAIKFVEKFYDKKFPEAVEMLIGETGQEPERPKLKEKPQPQKTVKGGLEAPAENESMRRVYGYLVHDRGLDKDVVSAFARKGLLYESEDHHNAVFVGKDTQGVTRHVSVRSSSKNSNFRRNIENSEPEFSFRWYGKGDTLYAFEAPIDMLSYISMHKNGWEQNSYVACCGTSPRAVEQMLKDNGQLKKVYLCLDNDEAGQKGAAKMSDMLFDKGVACRTLVPENKDWNLDLLASTQTQTQEPAAVQEEVEGCQMSQC